MEQKLMNLSEVCLYLGVHRDTIRRLRARSEHPFPALGSGKILRFRLDQVDAWMARETELAAAGRNGGRSRSRVRRKKISRRR